MKGLIKNVIRKIKYRIDPIAQAQRDGVKIGKNCRLIGDVFFGSEPYLIKLGDHVSITSSRFITHDGGVWVFREKYPDIDIFGTIVIGTNVFIGSGCTILPGTEIGNDVVVGAGSLVRGNLASGGVYAGVPVKYIKSLADYSEKIMMSSLPTKSLNREDKRSYLTGLDCFKL